MKTKKSERIKHGTFDASDHLDKLKSLDKLFEYSFRNYSFYSQSIDDYINKRKPSLRRRVIYHTITVNLLITSIINLALLEPPAREGIKYYGVGLTFISFDDHLNWQISVSSSVLSFINFYSRCYQSNCENRFDFYPFHLYYVMKSGKRVKRIKFRPICLTLANVCVNYLNIFDNYYIQFYILIKSSNYCFYLFGTGFNAILFIVNLAHFVLWAKTVVDMLVMILINVILFKK